MNKVYDLASDLLYRLRNPPKPFEYHENYLVMAEAAVAIEGRDARIAELEALLATLHSQYHGTTPDEVMAVRKLRKSFAEFGKQFPEPEVVYPGVPYVGLPK